MAESLEIAQVRERLRTDTAFWAEHCATILTPEKRPVRLKARPWQARTPDTPEDIVPLDEALERQRAAGVPMRALILKARKLGFSTWAQAKFMQRVTQMPYQYALTAAHRRDAGRILFDMARLMYRRLPTEEELGLGFAIKPQWIGGTEVARQGNGYMTLGDRRRPEEASTYEVMTAGGKGGGRASTPTQFHGSEVAHYDDPEFLIGALNAVPKIPETIIILESTANGFNHFYDRWVRASDGAEDPDTGGLYAPLFYGWQHNPFNALPFTSDQARDRFAATIGDPDGGGDEEETWLVDEYGVTLEQLRWRRVVISEDCDGKIEKFHQEHPATPEQAFIGSGNPVFSAILVAKAIKQAELAPAPVEGVLRGADFRERRTKQGTILIPERAVWVPRAQMNADDVDLWGMTHPLRVWEHPVNDRTQEGVPDAERKPDGQYVTFVDVAQGVAGTTEERDYTAIQVIDHVSRMQVASYRSRIALHEVPLISLLIAVYFNQAWLAPEATGLGIGVVDALRVDYRYPRLYRRRRAGDDTRQDARENLLGWYTDLRTKPLLEMTFGQALKEGTHGIRDIPTAREFTTYVESRPGKHEAQPGAFDDLAMSYMGAVRVASELKPRDPSRKPSGSGGRRRVGDDITGY